MSSFFHVFYQTAMVLSMVSMAFVFWLVWQWRRSPGAVAMLYLSVATFIWTLGFLLEANSQTLDRQLFFNNVGYIGSMTVPVAWLLFSLLYIDRHKLHIVRRVIPFCIISAFLLILVWTNPLHHLMWFNEHLVTSGTFTITVKTYGTLFWITVAYNYLLIIGAAGILVSRLSIGEKLYTRQAIALFIAVGVPFIWNIIYVFDILNLPRKDLTPAMFAFSSLAIGFGVMRFRLFAAAPFAREFVIQQLRDGVLVFDLENRLTEANPAALSVLNADGHIIGTKAELLQMPPEIYQMLSSPDPGKKELQLSSPEGERFYELEKVALRYRQQMSIGWIIILRDVSDRRRLQAQLMVNDRLIAIGQLTSGIAHELNNPLTSIIGFSELLLNRDLPADIRSDLEVVSSQAGRVSEIINNLLTFVQGNPVAKSPIDMNEVVQQTLDVRSYEQTRKNIRTVFHRASALPWVKANKFQIGQAFLNIVINAEYFMLEAHGRGVLTVTTEQSGNSVRVSFSDDGPGISGKVLPDIFNPFFTTKEIGKGTGLGLSICHGIVAEHGGRIWAESEVGKGTTFFIELSVYPGKDLIHQ